MTGVSVYTEDHKSRNTFLSFFLMIWGVIYFSVAVRDAKESTTHELYAAAGFFVMLGAFMSLILFSIDHYDRLPKLCTIFILCIGFILVITAGGYHTDKTCNNQTDCGCKVFGEIALIPAIICLIIAIDLYTKFLNDRRIRMIVFSSILMINGILVCVYYFKQDQSKLSDEEKCTEGGFLLITVAAGLVFLVNGIFQKTDIALFNAFMAFAMFIGIFLVLVSDQIAQSTFLVWYILLFCLVFIVTSEAQSGGTIRVRRR